MLLCQVAYVCVGPLFFCRVPSFEAKSGIYLILVIMKWSDFPLKSANSLRLGRVFILPLESKELNFELMFLLLDRYTGLPIACVHMRYSMLLLLLGGTTVLVKWLTPHHATEIVGNNVWFVF